ncbi:hypothetical protein ABBQ38_003722 [Trebouxia sp. C0009 RCD-2024]
MGAEDVQALYKAAKAQRGGGASLSKEQLKKLRAQKAASAQQAAQLADAQRAKVAAAATAAQARQKSAAGMPPPAPRAPSGSLPASTGNKSAVSGSSGKPQAAIIRPKPQAAGERSVNRTAQESAMPSGDIDHRPAMSSDSQQAQWLQGAADKQSTASTSEITSHPPSRAAPAGSPPAAGSVLAAGYGSDEEEVGPASIQGSAATAAEQRDSGSQSANGLPSGFFEAAASTAGESGGAAPQRAERALSMESAASASLSTAAIPKGFFENKEADAKARGQKLPKKKDPKQEYDNFLKSIADDVQEVEARQEVEAVEAAQDKADQEAFEHGLRLRRIEELRAMSTGPSTAASQTSPSDADMPGAGAMSIGSVSSMVPANKKRKRNVSVEVDKADASDSSDDDDAENGDDALLDWRAKTF